MSTIASPSAHYHGRELPTGFIFDVARAAGIEFRCSERKCALRCPFHEDLHASAFLSPNNIFYCSVCTPRGGWSAKRFCLELGVDWQRCIRNELNPLPESHRPEPPTATAFSAADARVVWEFSFAHARDDGAVEDEREAYAYLHSRGLGDAWELGVYGLLPGSAPHAAVRSWRARGYRVVLPLFDADGNVSSLQARSINGSNPKTLVPTGSRITGTVFADRRGQRLLKGEGVERVILGEGLTDLLALAISSPWPVLSASGTSLAAGAVGTWARGVEVLLALDCDPAGEGARPAVVDALRAHGARRVRIVRWPGGAKDACDVLAQRGAAGLESFLAKAEMP
jgi:Toprim-like